MIEDQSEVARDLLSGVTDEMVTDALGYREDEALGERGGEEGTAAPPDWRDAISETARGFIIRWETGGRSYYERVIRGRPIWPGYSSGITIGCGYDLGYHKAPEFQRDWGRRMSGAEMQRLAGTLGFRTTEPNRPEKVRKAGQLVASLSDIVVPWTTAIEQFEAAKLPAIAATLYRSLDNLDRLHPHSRGALLSLVFNRGASFRLSGPRYAEMREIGAAMSEGSPPAILRIPDLLRSMSRIWGRDSSLAERREGEARLFEAGLEENRLLGGLVGGQEGAVGGVGLAEAHETLEEPQSDVADEDEEAETGELETVSPLVRWNPSDDEQPDYRHLDTKLARSTAEILPEDLDALIAANDFSPRPGRIVFALRGAALVGGDMREDVASITITDQRPDHADFRCVIGAYDPARRRFWAYRASTVPNAHYVLKCHRDHRAGVPVSRLTGNILPTGCYTVTVGAHRRGTSSEIPAVLRLSTTATGASKVVVLRSLENPCYDRFDRFVEAIPGDNVHPAQRRRGFSSAGCLTLPGSYANGRYSGAWQAFRAAAGFDESTVGKQFSLVLLTGLDAVMAAQARRTGAGSKALRRLRHGSQGARVARLQEALGLAPDRSQTMGPVTRAALWRTQTARLGWGDAIHSPEMDALLGFGVFDAGSSEPLPSSDNTSGRGSPEAAGLPGGGAPGGSSADGAGLSGSDAAGGGSNGAAGTSGDGVPSGGSLNLGSSESGVGDGGSIAEDEGELAQILAAWRAGSPAERETVRFVAEFGGAPRPDDETAEAASTRLGMPVKVGPLFESDSYLDRFRLMTVEAVAHPDRTDLFEVAAALRDAVGATSVEPDLGSDYYGEEPGEGDRRLESSDLAYWCWASERRDLPGNRDWAIESIRAREAWALQPPAGGAARGKGIRVFQPDTGVVSDHLELPPGVVANPGAVNLVEPGRPPEDPRQGGSNPGHGTATASVVVSPVGGSMAGAAPGATLAPIRCVETVAVFNQSRVAQAIDHARRNGAHVITMSLGGVPSLALHAALRRAVEQHVIVLAAAGNCVEEVVWPARYNAAIAVAGVNEAGLPWRGSSHGPSVDISAPAEFVLRADGRDRSAPPSAVSGGQGTSFAVALTAGVAALWLAHHGRDRLIGMLPAGRRLQDMFRILLRKSAHVPPRHDVDEYGPGVLRADRLLQQDPATAFAAAHETPATAQPEHADGLPSLLARVYGAAGEEAAGRALLDDRQHALEIACLALDRARLGGTRRAYLEALPPAEISTALRRKLGRSAAILAARGGGGR